MFNVKPYYLSSSGTLDMQAGYYISRPDNARFNVEVPLASSIESTMEWCDRVAARHAWHELEDPICDTSGFYWLHHDGNRVLKRVYPSGFAPYQITGDSLLGSGFYNRYRDIIQFMGENNLQDWEPSGYAWPNMSTLASNNSWKNIQNLNNYPQIEKNHYHQYIYRGTEATPYFWGGIFTKGYDYYKYGQCISEPYDELNAQHSGWEIPRIEFSSVLYSQRLTFDSGIYTYIPPFGNPSYQPKTYTDVDLVDTFQLNSGYFDLGIPNSIDTYERITDSFNSNLVYSLTCPLITSNFDFIGLMEHKAALRRQAVRHSQSGDVPGSSGSIGIFTADRIFTQSEYSVSVANSFCAYYYPLSKSVMQSNYPPSINKTIKHLIGVNDFDFLTNVSGFRPMSPTSGYFYQQLPDSGVDTASIPDVEYYFNPPGPNIQTLYGRDDIWYSGYKVVAGFINMSGSRLISGTSVTYNDVVDANEASVIGNKTANKIRNGEYTELLNAYIPYPQQSVNTTHLASYINTIYSDNINIIENITLDQSSDGNNAIFIAAFQSPFEGGNRNYDVEYINPPNANFGPYEYDVVYIYPGLQIGRLNATSTGLKKVRRGGVFRKDWYPTFNSGIPPSSINLPELGKLRHNTQWW